VRRLGSSRGGSSWLVAAERRRVGVVGRGASERSGRVGRRGMDSKRPGVARRPGSERSVVEGRCDRGDAGTSRWRRLGRARQVGGCHVAWVGAERVAQVCRVEGGGSRNVTSDWRGPMRKGRGVACRVGLMWQARGEVSRNDQDRSSSSMWRERGAVCLKDASWLGVSSWGEAKGYVARLGEARRSRWLD